MLPAVARKEDESHLGVLAQDLREQLDAAHAHTGHSQVADDLRRPGLAEHLKRFARVAGYPAPLRMSSTSWPTQRNLATINTSRGGGDI
jgi:hypothetical protein